MDEVYARFKRVVQNRKKLKVEEMIDGCGYGFCSWISVGNYRCPNNGKIPAHVGYNIYLSAISKR